MNSLTPAPTETTVPLGAMRWLVEVVSGKSIMKAGVYTEQIRYGFQGSLTEGRINSKEFTFGRPSVGGPPPENMPHGAIIDQTTDPDFFLVHVKNKGLGVSKETVLMGREVFQAFGYKGP